MFKNLVALMVSVVSFFGAKADANRSEKKEIRLDKLQIQNSDRQVIKSLERKGRIVEAVTSGDSECVLTVKK